MEAYLPSERACTANWVTAPALTKNCQEWFWNWWDLRLLKYHADGTKLKTCLPTTIFVLICLHFFFFNRCHTLAFVPSRGRVYAFGLGGSGQLGVKVTCNMNAPQLVEGPWSSIGSCLNPDKAAPDSIAGGLIEEPIPLMDADCLEQQPSLPPPVHSTIVRKTFCGGDQSFVLVGQYTVRFTKE